MEKTSILGVVIGVLIGGAAASPDVQAQSYCNASGCQVFASRPGGGFFGSGGGYGSYDQSVPREDYRDPAENLCQQIFSSVPPGCDLRNPPDFKANGCGADGGIAIPNSLISLKDPIDGHIFGEIFKAACDQHDACYAVIGVSKSHCDNRLREDMVASAKQIIPVAEYARFSGAVEAQAIAYSIGLQWGAVAAFASGPAFNAAQDSSYCRNSAAAAMESGCI